MSVFIPDKDAAKLSVHFFFYQNNPKSNISARISWSISEILKLFKKLALVYYLLLLLFF